MNNRGLKKSWVLGVDGGGTKTVACIASLDRLQHSLKLNIEGRGKAGPSNPRSVGFEEAFRNIQKAVDEAKKHASIHGHEIDHACLSLAGAGRVEEQNRIRQWAHEAHLARSASVVDDVEPLASAAEYEYQSTIGIHTLNPGTWERSVTLVAGTGSIACGKNEHGTRVRVGGWGYLLGDEGSGFWIGLSALKAICRDHDGCGPKTSLTERLLDGLGFTDPKQLVGYVYQTPLPRDEIASLSNLVVKAASSDPVASEIIISAVDAWTQLITTVVHRLNMDPSSFGLCLSGGLLAHHPSLMETLEHQLKRRDIVPTACHLVQEPVYGPLLIASLQDRV
jgi:N-acetylglucosamine kinase-like BadF-type ATPase